MSRVRVTIVGMTVMPVFSNDKFRGDYVWECNHCDLGSSGSTYHVAVSNATAHASKVHPELVMVANPKGVCYV